MSYSSRKKTLLSFFAGCFLFITVAQAQYDNEGLKEVIPIDSSDVGWLKFRLSNENFLKNNEYFNPLMVGQTYFGVMLHSSLTWNPNRYMRLQAGVFLRDDFGNNTIFEVIPTFTLKLQKNGYAFLFGTIEGTVNHNFIQPLYDFERYMSDHIENGVQFTAKKKFLEGDLYLSWEHHQYAGIPHDREILNTGATVSPVLFNKNKWKISVPLQAIIVHHGGQLDTFDLPHDESLFDDAAGIRLSYFPGTSALITEIRMEDYYVYYQDLGHHYFNQLFLAGHGVYANLLLKSKYHVDALLSYWYSHDFISGHGGYLYQSVSQRDPAYTEPFRKLMFFSLMYEKELFPGLTIVARFEGDYNFFRVHNTQFEYSYSFYMVYRPEFRLVKMKKDAVLN
ncbi:MAG TPA: hypothetical protein VE978_25530 [Chitinophagales bacterium]|nr:hypothetical protein [Chitinophagales bacterium]